MKNALLVDDIAAYTEAIEVYLEDNFTVYKAASLDEALEIARSHTVDLALVDIRLDEADPQNKDGIELVKKLKEIHPQTAVIVMSAYQEFDYAVEALNAGADYFMKKPVNPDELLEAVNKLFAENH